MRNTSTDFREAVYGQQTSEAFIVLIDIDHADLSEPIRICNAGENITSNGNLYLALPFELSLPDEPSTGVTVGKIAIDNIGQEVIDDIRSISTAPSVEISIILASAPDTVEVSFSGFEMTNINYDLYVISADIGIETFMGEPYPGDAFIPSMFPGLF